MTNMIKKLAIKTLTLVLIHAGSATASNDPVTADPKTGANFNRYYYANNNPYRFKDPDGRVPRGSLDLCSSGGNSCTTYTAGEGVSARHIRSSEIKAVSGTDKATHSTSARALAKDANALGMMLTKKGDPLLVSIFNRMRVGIDYTNWAQMQGMGDKVAKANFDSQAITFNNSLYFAESTMGYRVENFSHEIWHLTPSNRQQVLRDHASCSNWSNCSWEKSAVRFATDMRVNYWNPSYEYLPE